MFFIGVLIIGATREGKNAIKNTAGLSVWRSCGVISGAPNVETRRATFVQVAWCGTEKIDSSTNFRFLMKNATLRLKNTMSKL